MIRPKEHGGIAGMVDFGYIIIAVMADCTICKTSTMKTWQLLHKPVPEATVGGSLAMLSERRAASPQAPLWDEVEKYPFKVRAQVQALASAMAYDVDALFYELSELGVPLDHADAEALAQGVIKARRRASA